MTWPEKKKNRIFVRYLTDNAVDHSAIQVGATCQPATKTKIHLQENQSYDFKDKQPKLWR